MLQQLKEEDFLALRSPFESGRQSPKALGAVAILFIFFQALLLFIEYYGGQYATYPFKNIIFKVHLIVSVMIAIISIIFAIRPIYMRHQKNQYFLNTIQSQNLGGISFYIVALLVIGNDTNVNKGAFLNFIYLTLIIGIIIFIATSIRFYILLKKGKYRKETKKDYQRRQFEGKSLLPIAIPAGIGIVFIIQYLIRTFDFDGIDTMVMSVFMIGIFYTMLFVLPEQLVLQYCKIRFDSFNYEQNGRLKPVRDEDGNIIME
ncbi:hypothetical protein [Paraliobacillus ryukyuensis]|uniref:hypothetical protein n=1 Tax=Paraliobacillus ryukyuensis TaxID=200904 RepID=UPI0009A64606|nr:hypothetical protein [Paraliobacillus ryukyuensis]